MVGMVRSIVITGASSGIGKALAQRYAREGVRLGLLGRNEARLEAVADECRALVAVPDVPRPAAVLVATFAAAMTAVMIALHRPPPPRFRATPTASG